MKDEKNKRGRRGRPANEDRETKRRHLIREARNELLRTGGSEFRLNQVLKAAGGSKTTLYSYFGDRDGLLKEVLAEAVEEAFPSGGGGASSSRDIRATLLSFSKATYQAVLNRETMALYRMAIAEAKSVPLLAKVFYSTGPARAREILSRLLKEWHQAGALRVPQPELAAEFFFGLLLEGPVLRKMLMLPAAEEKLDARAKEAVEVFLRAYQP